MSTVTLKGNPISIKGDLPAVNSQAQDFTFVKADLSESTLEDYGDKVKILLACPA